MCFKTKRKLTYQKHNKFRVLFVIGSLELGGAEKQMTILLRYLNDSRFKCFLFVLDTERPFHNFLKGCRVKIYEGGYSHRKSIIAKCFILMRAQLLLIQIMRKINPNVVHAFLPLANIMASLSARLSGVSRIITSRRAIGTHQERIKGWRIFDIISFFLSHYVTANSIAVANDTIKRDCGKNSKLIVIYNGIDSSTFKDDTIDRNCIRQKLGVNPKQKAIITIANLIPYKGHSDLLDAAIYVLKAYSQAKFFFVGEDRGILGKLKKKALHLEISDKIIFLEQRLDVPGLLTASDISVLPSYEEGFSNVILESMAARLPVVATRVGGNAEAVVDGVTGWLVPPKSPVALADKIVDLLKDENKAKAWGRHGHYRVKKKFSIEKMVNAHIKLYGLP